MSTRTVLVVEDEREVAELIRNAIRAAGYDCTQVTDVEAADAAVARATPAAITLDISLRGERDGLEWLDRLAAEHPELARRTIVVTATDLTASERRRIEGYGAELLRKPVRLRRMVERVRAKAG